MSDPCEWEAVRDEVMEVVREMLAPLFEDEDDYELVLQLQRCYPLDKSFSVN